MTQVKRWMPELLSFADRTRPVLGHGPPIEADNEQPNLLELGASVQYYRDLVARNEQATSESKEHLADALEAFDAEVARVRGGA